jgi:hypothetical protein
MGWKNRRRRGREGEKRGKGREGKGREGKGREGKGREGREGGGGRDNVSRPTFSVFQRLWVSMEACGY